MPDPSPHYLVMTIGTTGDVYPLIRIASALQALGRKVTFITNTYHTNLLKGSGLEFVQQFSIQN